MLTNGFLNTEKRCLNTDDRRDISMIVIGPGDRHVIRQFESAFVDAQHFLVRAEDLRDGFGIHAACVCRLPQHGRTGVFSNPFSAFVTVLPRKSPFLICYGERVIFRIIFICPDIDENFFIIFCITRNCFSTLFTSESVVPEPPAIRFLRAPSMIEGLRRSSQVMERMIASIFFRCDGSSP